MLDLNGIKLENPYIIASGPLKYGRGYHFYENPVNFFLITLGLIDPSLWGATTTKTITLPKRAGNYRWWKPWRVIKKIPGGYANRFGWNNCGIDIFSKQIFSEVKSKKIIVSIGALNSPDEFIEIILKLNKLSGILAVELNISCPHVEILFRNDLNLLKSSLEMAKIMSIHPLIVKLGPTDNPIKKAIIAEECGINAISGINTELSYIPGFGDCGISGPVIKKTALKVIADITNKVSIPVIGGGGIMNDNDAQDFFSAGAKAVAVSSLFFHPIKLIKFQSQI